MSTDRLEIVRQMIAQQGAIWAETEGCRGELLDRSRSPVVVAFHPDTCYRLTLSAEGEWQIQQDKLFADEIGKFFVAFGTHWAVLLNSQVTTGTANGDHQVTVRAFIKNGRKAGQEWSISIGDIQ